MKKHKNLKKFIEGLISNMTKRLTCPKCGADNHFGNLKCKDCAVEL